MEATIDAAGRLPLPKHLLEELGLTPGSVVEVSDYGEGLLVRPKRETAQVEMGPNGYFVGTGSGTVTTEDTLALIDEARCI